MKKLFTLALALLLLASCEPKGYNSYTWEYHELDSRYDTGKNPAAMEAISKYDSLMAPLQEILCYSDDIYVKEKPESGLSNFMADAIREFASQYSGETIDVGLMNFGGIRTDMPKGAVRVYDIYAISPFNNYLTIIQVKGSTLRRLFNRMAAGHLEALSGVRMKIDDKHLKECLVGGKPLDDNRTYTVATIDFLVTGGDGIDFGDGILFRGDTGVLLRDAIISILKQKMAAGETLNLKKDGRVVINYSKR